MLDSSFEFVDFSNSSSSTVVPLHKDPRMPVLPMEGNCLTKIIKDTPPITDFRVIDSDDDITKVNDIWLDMNFDCSLSKLLPSEEKQIQTDNNNCLPKTSSSSSFRKTSSLRQFRKTKGGVVPVDIEKPANVIDSTTKESTLINEKSNNETKIVEKKKHHPRKSVDSALRNFRYEPYNKSRSKSADFNANNNSQDQDELLNEFKNLKKKNNIVRIQENDTNINVDNENFDSTRLNSTDCSVKVDDHTKLNENKSSILSLPMLPDTKPNNQKRRFSSIFDDDPLESNYVGSDIKIQLPNVNLEIKDKTESTTTTTTNTSESIKIEINVSRIETQRAQNDNNEIIGKSNQQQVNISLPLVSCKVDSVESISKDEEKSKQEAGNKIVTMDDKKTSEKDNSEDKDATVSSSSDNKCLGNDNESVDVGATTTITTTTTSPIKETHVKLDKKEQDIENALKKLDECRRNYKEIEEEKVTKESECIENKNFLNNETIVVAPLPGSSKDFDFDQFDVEPFVDEPDALFKKKINQSPSSDKEHYRNKNNNSKIVGYLNPLYHLDELENLNAVPVYTTKDGKITYSPNPKFTYRALIIEARKREGHALFRDYYSDDRHGGRSNRNHRRRDRYPNIKNDVWYDNNKYSKSSRRKRTKNDDDYKRNTYEDGKLCYEKNDDLDPLDRIIDYEAEKIRAGFAGASRNNDDESDRCSTRVVDVDTKIDDSTSFSSVVLNNKCVSDHSLTILDDLLDLRHVCPSIDRKFDNSPKFNFNRDIVDLQNLKDDILKKLNDPVSQVCYANDVQIEETESTKATVVDMEINAKETSEKIKSEAYYEDKMKKENENRIKVLEEVLSADPSFKVELAKIEKEIEEEALKESEIVDGTKNVVGLTNLKISENEEIEKHEMKNNEIKESFDETDKCFKESSPDLEKDQYAQFLLELEKEPPRKEAETELEVKNTVEKLPEDIEIITKNSEQQLQTVEINEEIIEELKAKCIDSEITDEPENKTKDEISSRDDNEENSSPNPESLLKLTCSISKSNFSYEFCESFINQEKLHSSQIDSNNVKIIPKLVIRKSDSKFSKAKSSYHESSNTCEEEKNNFFTVDENASKSPMQPKIPKMIIRNAQTRPTTPCIEEISEESSCSLLTMETESKGYRVKKKTEEKTETNVNDTQNHQNFNDCVNVNKIPKMKIKLEEKLPRVVIENINGDGTDQQKIVPKMKITNVKNSLAKIKEKQMEDYRSDASCCSENESTRGRNKTKSRTKKEQSFKDGSSQQQKRINGNSNSSSTFSNVNNSKKAKRSPTVKDEISNFDPILEDTQFLLENEYRQRNNSNSKVPKVIIKRTSPSAEFKCELSKEAIVNAQPQVVILRSTTIESMAKNLVTGTKNTTVNEDNEMMMVTKSGDSDDYDKPEPNVQWQR